MTEDGEPPLSVNALIHSLAPVLYGMLHLLPSQVDELTFIDIDDMKRGCEEEERRKRWETAYWVSNIISTQVKGGITPEKLMEPFLPQKSAEDIRSEKDDIKRLFNLQ